MKKLNLLTCNHTLSTQRLSSFHKHVGLPVLILATISSILSTGALAQIPTPVCCMAFANVDENLLYIQGGFTNASNIQISIAQFIALDLTVDSWSTSAPPWVWPQSFGPTTTPTSSWHSMTVAKDRNNLFIWDPFQSNTGVWWLYTIGFKSWNYYANSLKTTKRGGIKNGVDMSTGIVYISSGNNDGLEMIMNIMNTPGSLSLLTLLRLTALMPVPVVHKSFLWSAYRNTFLHYGGRAMFGYTETLTLMSSVLPAADGDLWYIFACNCCNFVIPRRCEEDVDPSKLIVSPLMTFFFL